MEPSAWIELVLRKAPELRKAGVLEIGPESATFAPLPPPPLVIAQPAAPKTVEPETPVDPLHARETYGTGDVPGFDIEPLTEEL